METRTQAQRAHTRQRRIPTAALRPLLDDYLVRKGKSQRQASIEAGLNPDWLAGKMQREHITLRSAHTFARVIEVQVSFLLDQIDY